MATNPGIHRNFRMEWFDRDERSILNCLARSFYITSNAFINKGTAKYQYVLARPCDDIKQILNYDREIVIIFSSYDNFEVRSLESFRDVETKLSEIRVERTIRFLFSRDPDIKEIVKRFMTEQPEQPTICAFRYDDTRLFSTQHSISNHLRSIFFSRDLFNFNSPLRTEHFFFGRNDLLKSIIDRHLSGESTGLFGLRRTGKTSLIHALGRMAKAARQPFLHVDCQTTEIHLKNWYQLIQHITISVCKNLSIKFPEEFPLTEHNAAAALKTTLNEAMKRQSARMLITFDEVENISPKTSPTAHWRGGLDALLFWQTIREICQSENSPLSCLIVGINPILIEDIKLCGYDNPLFNFMKINYIKGFTHEHTHEMCVSLGRVMGLEFDSRSTNFLTDHFGGNPFLIRQACSHIHQNIAYPNRPAKVTLATTEDSTKTIDSSASTYASGMLEVLKDFYPNEFELLCWLAAEKFDDFNQYIKNNSSSIAHLCGYGVLEEEDKRYFFRVKIFKSAMQQMISKRPDLYSQDEMREYISKTRNSIERAMRQAARNISLSKFGKLSARSQIVPMLTKGQQEHLKSANLTDLFSNGESRLYLSDFYGIVTGLNQEFENLTGMAASDIKRHLSKINDARFDAHSNNISDDAFQKFRESSDALISALELELN